MEYLLDRSGSLLTVQLAGEMELLVIASGQGGVGAGGIPSVDDPIQLWVGCFEVAPWGLSAQP